MGKFSAHFKTPDCSSRDRSEINKDRNAIASEALDMKSDLFEDSSADNAYCLTNSFCDSSERRASQNASSSFSVAGVRPSSQSLCDSKSIVFLSLSFISLFLSLIGALFDSYIASIAGLALGIVVIAGVLVTQMMRKDR